MFYSWPGQGVVPLRRAGYMVWRSRSPSENVNQDFAKGGFDGNIKTTVDFFHKSCNLSKNGFSFLKLQIDDCQFYTVVACVFLSFTQ